MTTQKDQAEKSMEDASDVAEKIAALGSMDAVKESGAFDELMGFIDRGEIQLDGKNGFIQQIIRAGLERGLKSELSSHLGYDKGDGQGRFAPNSRNGAYPKTVSTIAGDIDLQIPRDRAGTFTPTLVPKGSRRTGGLDEMIISLYAGGMTVRDIAYHLETTVGTQLSHDTISKITDEVLDEVAAWQERPLEEFYPILYLDAIVIKVRDGHQVRNKAAHMAIGVTVEGIKHVLGIWVTENEGAKFWAQVCAQLANRGVKDVLIACCDGLTGFPEAIEATWSRATVQTCVVHLIRAANRFVSYTDRRAVSAQLKSIYTAPSIESACKALDDFEASQLGQKYPSAVATWRNAWERFTPFLEFPPELRKVIYTTNAIESMNYQLRKVTKSRGHFPSDAAAVKMLWLAICNIEDKRARERAKDAQKKGRTPRAGAGSHLIEGAGTNGWKQALQQLAMAYPERIEPYLK
ncbi:IS256 family transposase [Glutamicibacter arilaitensis]|uniref:IS256 family transposase n=1 Tax=Glutamicibacter arilaitensis TaxID=256701 RepID=UPI003F90F941